MDDRPYQAQPDAQTLQCTQKRMEEIAARACVSGGDLRISRHAADNQ
nr:MAG TPA: hypothetical protein [Caudoviricetes sp.]